jgi:hypothetical protein
MKETKYLKIIAGEPFIVDRYRGSEFITFTVKDLTRLIRHLKRGKK